jgi:hypothetical protein
MQQMQDSDEGGQAVVSQAAKMDMPEMRICEISEDQKEMSALFRQYNREPATESWQT